MKGKRGWIRIVEAVVALLIITGALLVAITGGYLREDISSKVYDSELAVLREISKDTAMRDAIVNIREADTPVNWSDFETNGLGDVKSKIETRIPSYLECVARLCSLDRTCEIITDGKKSIYARSIAITTTSGTFDPKQLKLFCWEKT